MSTAVTTTMQPAPALEAQLAALAAALARSARSATADLSPVMPPAGHGAMADRSANTRNWCMRTPANAWRELKTVPCHVDLHNTWVSLRFGWGKRGIAVTGSTNSANSRLQRSPPTARHMRNQWFLVVWPNRILRSRTLVIATSRSPCSASALIAQRACQTATPLLPSPPAAFDACSCR